MKGSVKSHGAPCSTSILTRLCAPLSLQETYEAKRNEFMGELQKKEEEMRQMFVQRVKEKEAELKEAEKEVCACVYVCAYVYMLACVHVCVCDCKLVTPTARLFPGSSWC